MAIKATVKLSSAVGVAVPGVYSRIDRIFGGKKEGWQGVVNFYDPNDTSAPLPIAARNIAAPYVEGENPYIALYTALAICDYLEDVQNV